MNLRVSPGGLIIVALVFLGLASEIMVERLSTRFDQPSVTQIKDSEGIIVLGGGSERIYEAVRLAQLMPYKKIIASGVAESELAFIYTKLRRMDTILVESRSTNTYENAEFTKDILKGDAGGRWVLVTSAEHMPRAVACFRKVGLNVVPWPARNNSLSWLGRFRNGLHEWMGLVQYWLTNRSDQLFPSAQI